MTQWIGAGALALCAAGAYAEDKRDCTDEEERAADRQLTAIAEDATWSKRLVKHHLPFDAQYWRTRGAKRANERKVAGSGRLPEC